MAHKNIRFLRLALFLLAVSGTCLLASCDEIKIEKREQARDAKESPLCNSAEQMLHNVVRLTSTDTNRQPGFSITGDRIIWLKRPQGQDFFQVWSMAQDGTDTRVEFATEGHCLSPAYSPDGNGFVISSTRPQPGRNITTVRADVRPENIAAWLFDPAFDICLIQGKSGGITQLTSTPGYDAEASFSWDGSRLVYSTMANDEGAIRQIIRNSGKQEQLLSWDGYIGGAALSPSGDQIVFQAAPRDGSSGLNLYICARDGSDVRLLSDTSTYQFSPAWHPSGEFIIFAADEKSLDFELFIIEPNGDNRQRVTFSPGTDAFPSFSRNGMYLVWTSSQRGDSGFQSNVFRATWQGI